MWIDDITKYNYYYNMTMTYRMDSDIFYSYGRYFDLVTNKTITPNPNIVWKPREEDFYGR